MTDKTKRRVDVLLKEWGLAPSRSKAQELIAARAVELYRNHQWQTIHDDAMLLAPEDAASVRLKANPVLDFVSRGGRKLDAALSRLQLSVEGQRALDIGLSTGGFADCLLQRGVGEVVGIDVGHGQLAESLKREPRLRSFDGVNAREIRRDPRLAEAIARPFDLIVVDLSFISLTLVLAELPSLLKGGGRLLALAKPQFEVSPGDLNKKGVVTDLELHRQVREKVMAAVKAVGLEVREFFPSEIIGQDGNQEYFVYAEKP